MASANGKDTLQQMGSIWQFLDKMALTKPDEYKTFVDKILKDGEANDMGPPKARFALQTFKIPEVVPVRRYFINIAEWIQIDKPKSPSSPVPVAASEKRKDIIDKEPAFIFDVVLHPDVFPKDTTDALQCASIIELVFRYIESKNSLKFSRKYVIVEKKYVGNPDILLNFMCPSVLKDTINNANTIQDEQRLLKQVKESKRNVSATLSDKEISSDSEPSNQGKHRNNNGIPSPLVTTSTNFDQHIKEVNTKLYTKEQQVSKKLPRPKVEMITEKENVEFIIYLPRVTSVSECELDITENSLNLSVKDKYQLVLPLPIKIDPERLHAKFVKDHGKLVIDTVIRTPKK